MAPDLEAATDFYVRRLGFRHSDDIEAGLKVRFLHCNPRHHTVALVAVPGHRGVHHVMLEVDQLDDVGLAYDRENAAGLPIAMTLGNGLLMQTELGFNPYKLGLVGSSDTQVGAGSFDEDDYWSKVGFVDATPEQRGSVPIDEPDADGNGQYAGADTGISVFECWRTPPAAGQLGMRFGPAWHRGPIYLRPSKSELGRRRYMRCRGENHCLLLYTRTSNDRSR